MTGPSTAMSECAVTISQLAHVPIGMVEQPHARSGRAVLTQVLPCLPHGLQALGGIGVLEPLGAPRRVNEIGDLALIDHAEEGLHEFRRGGIDQILIHDRSLPVVQCILRDRPHTVRPCST
jgi:hypothetical protein